MLRPWAVAAGSVLKATWRGGEPHCGEEDRANALEPIIAIDLNKSGLTGHKACDFGNEGRVYRVIIGGKQAEMEKSEQPSQTAILKLGACGALTSETKAQQPKVVQ